MTGLQGASCARVGVKFPAPRDKAETDRTAMGCVFSNSFRPFASDEGKREQHIKAIGGPISNMGVSDEEEGANSNAYSTQKKG